MSLRVGSLFAGIGGFDLGFERVGMQTVWQVEQNDFCRAVLAHHFPDAERFVDVRDVGPHNLAPVDLICGGFPCQDISLAGKGAGIDGARSGLWAEFARIIGELGPRYVVVENVPAIRSRGLDRVLRDLAAIGYDAEWDCLPASALGAPHQRDRFWLVAYPNADGRELIADRAFRDGWEVRAALGGVCAAPHGLADSPRHAEARAEAQSGAERERVGAAGQRSGAARVADPDGIAEPQEPESDGSEPGQRAPGRGRQQFAAGAGAGGRNGGGSDSPRVGGLDSRGRESGDAGALADADGGRGEDGGGLSEGERRQALPDPDGCEPPGGRGGVRSSDFWAVEPDVGRVADGVPARVDRLSALGNALVPQIAEWIGHRILAYEEGPDE